jgi:hypothetical protein
MSVPEYSPGKLWRHSEMETKEVKMKTPSVVHFNLTKLFSISSAIYIFVGMAWFIPMTINVEFVVRKETLGHVFLRVFWFPAVNTPTMLSISLSFIPRWHNGTTYGPHTKQPSLNPPKNKE